MISILSEFIHSDFWTLSRKEGILLFHERKRQFLISEFSLPSGKGYMIKCIILIMQRKLAYWWKYLLCFFFRITDLGNIKRRLYLSTVHKELSSTPLHAKIPLFMIKRKIVSVRWKLLKILNLLQQIVIINPFICRAFKK